MKKRILAIMAAFSLCISMASCGETPAPAPGSEPASPSSSATEPSSNPEVSSQPKEGGTLTKETADGGVYSSCDTSEPMTINFYMVGDVPADLDLVLQEANVKYLQPVLNTTMKMTFLSWSDYETKYSLVLAGGEDVDLMYTATWCFYTQEASKGAFLELTDDFMAKYMPQTVKSQEPASMEQFALNDKIYAVPRNSSPLGYEYCLIRDDLREKYNLPEPKSIDDYEKYIFTIAENEPSIQALASNGENAELRGAFEASLGIQAIPVSSKFVCQTTQNPEFVPKPEEITYRYLHPYYLDFAKRMATWAEKGVWSKNAINNTLAVSDAFAQGKSASMFWNVSVFTYGKQLQDAGLGTPGYYDLYPDTPVARSAYADATAIAANSKKPERAALVLDFIKNNRDLNTLLIGGIEGKHYMLEEDDSYSPGPDADKYAWDCWGWGIHMESELKPAGQDPAQTRLEADIRTRLYSPKVGSFTFDTEKIKSELAVVESLVQEYEPSFELGAFGAQTEAKYQEFVQKLEGAGIQKCLDELRTQYSAYLTKKELTPTA